MRVLIVCLPMVLLAAPFAACGNSVAESGDAGVDAYIPLSNDATDELQLDAPFLTDAGTVDACALAGDADPVGICVQQVALDDLHHHAFAAMKGAAASWNSTTETPDKNEAGAVTYSLDDTVAYAAAISHYLASAAVYGNTTIDAELSNDLQAIAYQLETSFAPAATEYSGELYFHLRSMAVGLRAIELNIDAAKFDKLADAYGRGILTKHYFALGSGTLPMDAGTDSGGASHPDATSDGAPVDAGTHDATLDTGPVDAGAHDATLDAGSDAIVGAHDATPGDAVAPVDSGAATGDGIIGNQVGTTQVSYAPGDVATAAYALLDLASRNQTDPSLPLWLGAVRASLNHLQARAKDPATGRFHTALVASLGAPTGTLDALAPSTNPLIPADALLADTQATYALSMVRAQSLVTSNTLVTLNGVDADKGHITDGGVQGPFVPILDIPFEAWGEAAVVAMNAAPSLWDGVSVDSGIGAGAGYMDGYVPSTQTLITTKSSRVNAFMAAALERTYLNGGVRFYLQLHSLVQLLINKQGGLVPVGSNLITVLQGQTAYLRGATQAFTPLDAGPFPTSYTTSAVSAVIEGLNENFPVESP
jgi:hypothetical protein